MLTDQCVKAFGMGQHKQRRIGEGDEFIVFSGQMNLPGTLLTGRRTSGFFEPKIKTSEKCAANA